MLGGVCGRLMTHHPDVPLVSVHDALMTTGEHLPLVVRVLEEEFERRLRVVPALAVEPPAEGAASE